MKLVIFGKSGVGKTTQEKELAILLGRPRVVSTTTRNPRANEVNGVDYYFISREEFTRMKDNSDFAEVTIFKGNWYGAQKVHIPEDCLIVVEPHGLEELRKSYDDVVAIKLELSEEDRLARLDGRGTILSLEDEERFDKCPADYVVNAKGTVEEITKHLLKICKELGW